MKTEKLIEIANDCYNGICGEECPFYNSNECREDFIKQLTDKLEKAISDINKNCGNCMYKSSDYRQPPCSMCEAMEFDKWEWRGNAE